MRTIDKIITKANCQYGAPMGRSNKGTPPEGIRVYDCRVELDNGGYDKGGVYWGIGPELRVSYTKDLSYIRFYRNTDGTLNLPEKEENQRWNILSPDGFAINRADQYNSPEEVLTAFNQWRYQYVKQGYYSSNKGRIYLDELHEYCSIIVQEKYEE